MPRALHLCTICVVCSFVLSALAENSTALSSRLQMADDESSLDVQGVTPWHLKLNVQLFGKKGTLQEEGTIETWWMRPKEMQTVYTMPSYKATEVQSSTGVRRSKGASFPPALLGTVLKQVVHPMPERDSVESSKPDLRKQTIGKVPLDCIMLDRTIHGVAHPPLGLFPTYCFDPGQQSLRITYDYGTELVTRNLIGSFQGRHVATKIAVEDSGVLRRRRALQR